MLMAKKSKTGIAIFFTAILLTACSGSTTSAPNASIAAPAANAPSIPADFPMKAYPGGKVSSVDKIGPIVTVLFKGTDNAQTVRKWYDAELPKQGWTIRQVMDQQPDGSITMVADKAPNSAVIGIYPKYYPNGEARYSIIIQPKN
jgi:hypothetical protein